MPLGFILTIGSTVLCVVYGLRNWNKGYITDEEISQKEGQCYQMAENGKGFFGAVSSWGRALRRVRERLRTAFT